MNSLMVASQVGLWLLVLCLFMAVFALSRQIGLLHRRITPAGARMLSEGPAIGEKSPEIDMVDHDGRRVTLGAARAKLTLLVFVSPGCSTCAGLIPSVRSVWRAEKKHLEVILVSMVGDESRNREFVKAHGLGNLTFIAAPDLAASYEVRNPPYAVLVGSDGLVKAKGLVNHFEHLESLLTAARLGHATIESYMSRDAVSAIPSLAHGTIGSGEQASAQASGI